MSQNSTDFYHKHIQSNISRLDERKDKFIHQRLDFLKEFCEPIQYKINWTRQEIQRYKVMRDTQTEVIENEPKIKDIKTQINNYMRTHQYYQQKINQLQKQSISIEEQNKGLSSHINLLNYAIKAHPEHLGFHLPAIRNSNSQKYPQTSLSNSSSLKGTTQQIEKSRQLNNHRLIKISEKIQRFRSNGSIFQSKVKEISSSEIGIIEQKNINEDQKQQKSRLQSLRQIINRFNRTQALFHQCFQAKKNSIQKSVSQLQSKLITNRQEFLSICQAISSKQSKVSFQEFKRLSADEIVTLFISFVWLNRKLNGKLRAKRGLILQGMKKIGGLW